MNSENPSKIIKADRIGRSHYTAEFRAEVLAAFESSPLSGQAFAEQCGIKYPTFASWRMKAKKQGEEVASLSSSSPFLIAELAPAHKSGDNELRIELPGGSIVHVNENSSLELLTRLIKALA